MSIVEPPKWKHHYNNDYPWVNNQHASIYHNFQERLHSKDSPSASTPCPHYLHQDEKLLSQLARNAHHHIVDSIRIFSWPPHQVESHTFMWYTPKTAQGAPGIARRTKAGSINLSPNLRLKAARKFSNNDLQMVVLSKGYSEAVLE